MSKRFIDISRHGKAWRKLDPSLKQAWLYLWTNCDPSGIWEIDEELFEFENGYSIDIVEVCKVFDFKINGNYLLIPDFISVNYVKLKEGYNPHKPVFRAIEKNNLKLNPSLDQACFKLDSKLEDEEEDKDEEEEEDIISEEFEKFWNIYDKKRGDKTKVKKKFLSISKKNRNKIFEYLPKYKLSTPDKQFRKDPLTFLNNSSWNDEIIENNGKDKNAHGVKRQNDTIRIPDVESYGTFN